jgi:16S rRNA (guanine966-N2)-methyltransferase
MQIISGKKRGLKLYPLSGKNTRPTMTRTKKDIMNIIMNSQLRNYLVGKNVADLFAGTGNVGLEMISLGAKQCTFFENDKQAIKTLKQNIKKTGFENTLIMNDATNVAKNQKFDLIYMDAPYNLGLTEKSIDSLIKNKILNKDTLLIIQVAKEEEIPNIENFVIIKEKIMGGGRVVFLTHKS